jgi:hypothetical protein
VAGGTYNLIKEYSSLKVDETAPFVDLSTTPCWVIAVVRLDKPLTYSRKDKASVPLDPSAAAQARGKTLVITADCTSMQIQGAKESHTKQLSASLAPGNYNYINEILPGDWVLAWIVHGQDRLDDLVSRIQAGKACNRFDDGLKFVGRAESVRKDFQRDPGGRKAVRYDLTAFMFKELDTQIFYDENLSDGTLESQNIGQWLARVGTDIREVFAINAEAGVQDDNVHLLIPTFLEILVGRGVSKSINDDVPAQLSAFTGGGPAANTVKEAPFAYLVPKEVGALLGKSSRDASKGGGVLAYADILEVLFGVQNYSNSQTNQAGVFVPDIAADDELTTATHRYTGTPMLGCFLPQMPTFDNRPLWELLKQYLNPVVNEMYTCLRVSSGDQANGAVLPSVVVRQIPFTTPVLAEKLDGDINGIAYTGFMDMPRWVLPGALVNGGNMGRSDATRCNFVHVYGQDADSANLTVTEQLAQNAPIRDDVDVQRSGLHAYMATVACRIGQQVGKTPSQWMELIADHIIGSQWTLNGTLSCKGIQSPICEGDNLEFDGVVYHIESVAHACSTDATNGKRRWMTTINVVNGLDANNSNTDTDVNHPMYPGFDPDDLTFYDPGFTAESTQPAQKRPTDFENAS